MSYLITGWRRRVILALNLLVMLASVVVLVSHGVDRLRNRDRLEPARTLFYRIYSDDTWHYSVFVPETFQEVAARAGSPDGAKTFASADQQGRITVWAAKTQNLSPVGALAQCESAASAAGGKTTFTFSTSRFYVCRGENADGTVFYERAVIGQNRSYWFRWEYSPRWRKVYEPAVQQAVDSFNPGPLNVISK